MIGLLCFVLAILAAPIKSKMRLEAENAVLRHQLTVLRRRLQGRVRLTNTDRWVLIVLYRWFPSILQVLTIIRPETLIHWHRSGFRCYWRWKSRSLGGRPPIEAELRALIRQMSIDNPVWGAPRIHGELLKLGFEVAQSSVAKYMVKRRGPPDQGWPTFLRNCAPDIGGPIGTVDDSSVACQFERQRKLEEERKTLAAKLMVAPQANEQAKPLACGKRKVGGILSKLVQPAPQSEF